MSCKRTIKETLLERGLKHKFVAARLHIHPSTLSRKLKNPEKFSAVQMDILAGLLKIPIDKIDFNVKNF